MKSLRKAVMRRTAIRDAFASGMVRLRPRSAEVLRLRLLEKRPANREERRARAFQRELLAAAVRRAARGQP